MNYIKYIENFFEYHCNKEYYAKVSGRRGPCTERSLQHSLWLCVVYPVEKFQVFCDGIKHLNCFQFYYDMVWIPLLHVLLSLTNQIATRLFIILIFVPGLMLELFSDQALFPLSVMFLPFITLCKIHSLFHQS